MQFGKEASQTRDYGVAKNATHRAARPDPSLRKERLLRMTIKLHHYQIAKNGREERKECARAYFLLAFPSITVDHFVPSCDMSNTKVYDAAEVM